jgi:hypothetical protein
MRKKDIYTLSTLLILTIITATFSNNFYDFYHIIYIILVLSCAKFLLVAFNFMELKRAHTFWKVSLTAYLVLFIATILLII